MTQPGASSLRGLVSLLGELGCPMGKSWVNSRRQSCEGLRHYFFSWSKKVHIFMASVRAMVERARAPSLACHLLLLVFLIFTVENRTLPPSAACRGAGRSPGRLPGRQATGAGPCLPTAAASQGSGRAGGRGCHGSAVRSKFRKELE